MTPAHPNRIDNTTDRSTTNTDAVPETPMTDILEHNARLTRETDTETMLEEAFAEDDIDSLRRWREGETWATEEAPWVGSETAWRTGSIIPPPPAPQETVSVQPEAAFRASVITHLALTDEEMQTVLSTMAPPPEEIRPPSSHPFLTHAAVALAAALLMTVAAWVYGPVAMSSSERARLDTVNPPLADDSRIAALQPAAMPAALPALPNTFWTDAEPVTENEPMTAVSSDAMSEPPPLPEQVSDTLDHAQNISSSRRIPQMDEHVMHDAVTDPIDISPSEPTLVHRETDADVNPVDTAPLELDTAAVARLEAIVGPAVSPTPTLVVLPETPSRTDIAGVLDRLAIDVRNRCRVGDMDGRIVVELILSGETGRVVSARTTDDVFSGTPAGRCAARIAADARFSLFRQTRLTVRYPFDI